MNASSSIVMVSPCLLYTSTLKALRLGLARRESPEEEPKKNGSDTRKDA